MPVYNRRSLRQRLGTEILHDAKVGITSGSWSTQAGSYNIIDSTLADPTASGENMYRRHWLRLIGSAGFIQDLIVASFNTGSGAFIGPQTLATTILSGMPYELHSLISPADKDIALDSVIRNIRNREWRPVWATQGLLIYSLGAEFLDIISVRAISDPLGILSRGERVIDWFSFKDIAQGTAGQSIHSEVRINSALNISEQLIFDAIVTVSLGADDLATVNLESDTAIIWGAAAQCYWMLERSAPGQEASKYKSDRKEAVFQYNRLKIEPFISRKIQLDDPY